MSICLLRHLDKEIHTHTQKRSTGPKYVTGMYREREKGKKDKKKIYNRIFYTILQVLN